MSLVNSKTTIIEPPKKAPGLNMDDKDGLSFQSKLWALFFILFGIKDSTLCLFNQTRTKINENLFIIFLLPNIIFNYL